MKELLINKDVYPSSKVESSIWSIWEQHQHIEEDADRKINPLPASSADVEGHVQQSNDMVRGATAATTATADAANKSMLTALDFSLLCQWIIWTGKSARFNKIIILHDVVEQILY